jgi:signal transduction histidine kinase
MLRGRVIVWHDITERKVAETNLLAARDAAEAASRAKSAFLANMSHELRTPLSAIMGYCQLIRLEVEEQDVEHALQDLAFIESSGEHLLHMIANLLHLSQIEAGTDQLSLAPIDVAALLTEVADTMRPVAARKRNTLVMQADPGPHALCTDLMRLRQVLLNLLDNAAKFTEGGTIILSAHHEPGAGDGWVLFRVSDTGVGIGPDELGRLFDVFVEPDIQKRRKFGGTGVGLAISRYFCQAMGGDIQATSNLGRGTTVTVRLPAAGPANASALIRATP